LSYLRLQGSDGFIFLQFGFLLCLPVIASRRDYAND